MKLATVEELIQSTISRMQWPDYKAHLRRHQPPLRRKARARWLTNRARLRIQNRKDAQNGH